MFVVRYVLLTILIVLFAVGIYFTVRDDGILEKVTANRIEQALLANRVSPDMASCMAPNLADRLSINQLRKLERAAPQEGESRRPLSTGEAMARLRRVDDREAVEQVVIVAGGCGFELMMQRR